HEQLRFEVEAGRQSEIGVGRAGETIDAAVLAPAIGIDRAVERQIGRIVAGDDLPRGVDRHGGLERRQIIDGLPTVIEADPSERLIAPRAVRMRAAAAPALTVEGGPTLARRGNGGQRRRRASQCGRTTHGVYNSAEWERNKN